MNNRQINSLINNEVIITSVIGLLIIAQPVVRLDVESV